MSAATKQATVRVDQPKVSLRAITPLIWRRLRVTSDTTIAQLYAVLQIAMGWEDLHLHQFRMHGKAYDIYRDGGMSFADDRTKSSSPTSGCVKASDSSTTMIWVTSGHTSSGRVLPHRVILLAKSESVMLPST